MKNIIVNRVKINNCPSLPKDDPPEPWGSTLRSIQTGFLTPLKCPSSEMSIKIIESEWAHFMNYVYQKKWNSKYKTNHKTKHTELFGEYLLAILEMCIQIHPLHPINDFYKKGAAQWFDKICWDMKYLERENINTRGGVQTLIDEYRTIAYYFKVFMNPFDESHNDPEKPQIISSRSQINFSRLIEAVCDINKKDIAPNIIDTYWKKTYFDSKGIEHNGVVRALTNYITYLDKEGVNTYFIDTDNHLYMQNGKGKSRVLIPDKCIKTALNQLK